MSVGYVAGVAAAAATASSSGRRVAWTPEGEANYLCFWLLYLVIGYPALKLIFTIIHCARCSQEMGSIGIRKAAIGQCVNIFASALATVAIIFWFKPALIAYLSA